MRIFPPSIEIGPHEGFLPGKDLFGRAELGAGLTNLVSSVTEPFVMAVDGHWGSGKSTFLKMWAGHLRNEGFPVIYYDAFESDYVDDAFLALASQVITLVREKKKGSTGAGRRFAARAARTGRVLARSTLKVGIKLGTMGALGGTEISEIAEAVSSEVEELTDKYIGEMLTRQKEHQSTIDAFKLSLKELPAVLSPTQEGKPLIFIIDELDRCRPDYALALLERIKHFFSVQNVHFILGVHLAQLRNSVSAAYGAGVDSGVYLQKFIHLTFAITDEARYAHELSGPKYIEYLRRELKFSEGDRDSVTACCRFLTHFAIWRNLSLRDIERIMTNLALAFAYTNTNSLRIGPIVAGLCILRVVSPNLYVRAKQGRLVFSEVDECLGLNANSGKDHDRNYTDWEVNWWRYCLDTDVSVEIIQQFGKGLNIGNLDERAGLVAFIANKVIDKLTPSRN